MLGFASSERKTTVGGIFFVVFVRFDLDGFLFSFLGRAKLEQLRKRLYRVDNPSPRPGGRNRENDPRVPPEESIEKLKVYVYRRLLCDCHSGV